MRTLRIGFALFLFSFFAARLNAADLSVVITDPQSARVSGARLTLTRSGASQAISVVTTSAQGAATFRGLADGAYTIEVLAPGFAGQSVEAKLPQAERLTIQLAVAAAPQTVTVSAARTPLVSQASGAPTYSLEAPALENMQPVAATDVLRYVPGFVVSDAGRRGGLSSLFVRGGDSRYNKVIVEGVPVNDPGGTFDFGVVPMAGMARAEFVRGAESTLYGSEAMTSVVQFSSASGHARVPETTFGAEGGNYGTARGYASVAGAAGRFDYNAYAEQTNTEGQGINDEYANASQGFNGGAVITDAVSLRLRILHSNSHTGVQSFWNFNGQPLIPPDSDQRAHQNNLLASLALTVHAPGRWTHRFSGFEYNHQRTNVDSFVDPGRDSPLFGSIDFPFSDFANINRAGFEYQGEYTPRDWARTTFGYQFEDENGFVGDLTFLPLGHGLRLNHAVYLQQIVTWKRLAMIGGVRYVHNESFGDRVVPRATASLLAIRGNSVFSGTRLRFAYGEGIKEPRLEESFGVGGFFIIPNPRLKAESNRSLEGGFQQDFLGGKVSLAATYFNNLFKDQIAFSFDAASFTSQYVNLNRAMAEGAEVEAHSRITRNLSADLSYTYTLTRILESPLAFDPLLEPGQPLLRRPKHAGNFLVNYNARRWGAMTGVTAVGRRADSDFSGLQPPVNHAAGYARADLGGWFAVHRHVTAYANIENLFNRKYEEAAGYPALHINFRTGLRFTFGGE